MVTVNTQCERLSTLAPKVVSGAANASGDVLPNALTDSQMDTKLVYRMIQNLDANNSIYVAYGCNCTNAAGPGNAPVGLFHKILGPLQDLNVPTLERVSVWSTNAWSVATIVMRRQS